MSHTADVNGLQLFYRDQGSGTPLLLLHGFMGTGDDCRHVFAAPLDGYRVITPDQASSFVKTTDAFLRADSGTWRV